MEIALAKQQTIDFKKAFNFLFETVRGLLIYAKEGKFDAMFVEQGLLGQLCQVVTKCFIEHQQPIESLLSSVVSGKVVKNDEKYLDLLNYTIGTVKCFTQSSREVQLESVNHKMIPLLSITVQKVMMFSCSAPKKAMILVQITGAMRNLANIEKCHQQVA